MWEVTHQLQKKEQTKKHKIHVEVQFCVGGAKLKPKSNKSFLGLFHNSHLFPGTSFTITAKQKNQEFFTTHYFESVSPRPNSRFNR